MKDILLCDADFPDHFVNWAHPEDYIAVDKAFKPEYIYHHSNGYKHSKLLMRTCFELSKSKKFLPMTFVLDTGVSKPLYLSEKALSFFDKEGLLKVDTDLMVGYTTIFGRNVLTESLPSQHRGANVVGLPLLMRKGLQLQTVDGVQDFKLPSMPLKVATSPLLINEKK